MRRSCHIQVKFPVVYMTHNDDIFYWWLRFCWIYACLKVDQKTYLQNSAVSLISILQYLLISFFISIMIAEGLVPDYRLSYSKCYLICIYWSHKQAVCSSFVSRTRFYNSCQEQTTPMSMLYKETFMQHYPWMIIHSKFTYYGTN